MAAAYPELVTPGSGAWPRTGIGLQTERPGVRVQSMPVLTRRDTRTYTWLVLLWAVVNVAFWAWWLQPERIGVTWLYVLMSAALAYDVTLLPTAYLFFVGRMRQPRSFVAPPGQRVALITLCVPAQESLDVIKGQLAAMLGVKYPHDSWILDEGNDPAVRTLAGELGVWYFSRAGIERFAHIVALLPQK